MLQVTKKTLNLGGKCLLLERPLVMGILNVTPDSFYSVSRVNGMSGNEIVDRAARMLADGADILDIGGYSTRPGAKAISADEEMERVIPVIENLSEALPDVFLSVDTFRAAVAEAAVKAGAHLINDVAGGNLDADMFDTVVRCKVPYILMHMRGTPETMNSLTHYDTFPGGVIKELQDKVRELTSRGFADIIIDPGFGFSKTAEQNFSLISNLEAFRKMGFPILVGVSRKSTIYKTLEVGPEEALNGTTVLNTAALLGGADILRVHDVREASEAVRLTAELIKTKL